MQAAKNFSILLVFLFVSSCNLFKKGGSGGRIETEGSYIVVGQSTFSSGQEKLSSKIEGFVFDDYSKTSLSCGFVFTIDDTQYRTIIDSAGYFYMLLTPGTYQFKITSVGNKDLVTEPIRLNDNTQTQFKVYLGSDIMYQSGKKSNCRNRNQARSAKLLKPVFKK
jgi:hypothetical protein